MNGLKRSGVVIYVFAFFILISLTSGCSSGPEEKYSGFLKDYSRMGQGNYFHKEYIIQNAGISDYENIKVAPVNLNFLDGKTSCDTTELENLGTEFRQDLEKALEKKGFKVTSNPTGKTMMVSLAITNVEPPKVLQNLAVTAAGFFVPVPLPFDSDSMTAFEGKITDSSSGKVIAQFAEVQEGGGEGFSLQSTLVGGYTKFTNTSIVFNTWSNNIATLLSDLKTGTKTEKGKFASGASTLLKTAAAVV